MSSRFFAFEVRKYPGELIYSKSIPFSFFLESGKLEFKLLKYYVWLLKLKLNSKQGLLGRILALTIINKKIRKRKENIETYFKQ